MIQTQDLRVVVAGGGIVGLTTALAFRCAGAEVVVCERAEQIRATGTSIGIWKTAMSVFDELGVAGGIEAQGTPSAMVFRRADGDWHQTPGFDDSDREYLLIERGRLTSALADAVGHEHIRVGTEFVYFEERSDRIVATFADGNTEEADLLIGADGAFSVVRKQLIPGSDAVRDPGHEVWRALLPDCPVAFEKSTIVIGNNRTNGGYLRSKGNGALWLVTCFAAPPNLPATRKEQALAMARNLDDGGWNRKLFDIIEATPEEDVLRPPIMVVPPLPTWRSDRVALVGDAAHAMSPHVAAGATLGIEDATTLTRCLSTAEHLADGLEAYEADRIPHYEKVNELAKVVKEAPTPEEFAQRYVSFSHWMLTQAESLLGHERQECRLESRSQVA
jgi:2-polyprenyl-6-methoxyphenol hydroxylase-like FAD-dependent oxidoreductase